MKNVIFDDDDGMESMQNSLPPIIHCAFLYIGTADWDHHQKLCHWYSLHQMICTGSATEYLIILGNKRSRGPYDRINRHPPNCKRGLFLICAAGSYLTKRMAGRNVPPGMAVDTHQIFRSFCNWAGDKTHFLIGGQHPLVQVTSCLNLNHSLHSG
jgi:hypothetical protein